MDRRTELKSTLRIEDVPTVRAIVAQKLREAIMSGTFKPGQRLVERELCEMTGVSRPSIREALRLLEADGMVSTVPHRGPVVSTISLEEARQLYAARAVLEGYAGRECARLRDPAVVRRMGDALTRLKAAFTKPDMMAILEAKTDFYAALIGGCQNAFIERMLKPLHDRITLLRITSMSQPKRVNKSLREVTAIWRAIQSGDEDLAERCCVDHIRAAAVAALDMIERSTAKEKEKEKA
ncbi:GntR family transcriptional regulator [Bradyrhizobium erythrophlei]|jgi:DNA-binding GntR family transcriptional regulator|uniref:Transcriptional regulator, GntR family n=1 Tax=Bradyrhizobium erythrophlei TaxID=1437360 RepID=A0A1M7T3R7_9BRAD|nr:GntR family transcriptional regulator [Bradyrhizobium erythrophlei]SHN65294.1 transcriptional regulator, GntR family [Bradyrhizobium erythrophlei]